MKPEKVQIMPWLFLVRVNKEEQKAFKERIGKNSPFFMPVGLTFNSRNMEHGEIIQIGEDLKIYGWEDCRPGHTLIFHHTVEDNSNSANKQFWVFDDEEFNYYAIDELNVRGYYDGERVVPHPNYVFLKNIPCFDESEETDTVTGNKIKKSAGGLFLMADWENSSSNIAQKSEKIKQRIESLAKSKRTDEIQLVMESLEKERIELNRKAQMKKFLPYRLAWSGSNRKLDRDFGRKLVEDDVLFCYNKACLYITNFQDREYSYIICPTEHIGGLLNDKND